MTQVQARKSLGQNWLIDEGLVRRIVQAAEIGPDDVVIEIGAGTGALTRHLVGSSARVIAIELDGRLLEYLPVHPNLTVIQADALQLDYAAIAGLLPGQQVCFVGNLPYYITSALVRKMLESDLPTRTVVITVQLEVALRMVAEPGSLSILAVSIQYYGTPVLLFRLPASAFRPQPSVDSAVVRIVPHKQKSAVSPERFFEVVRAGFSQPRKQLRNPLSAGLSISKSEADAVLHWAGINPMRRAETLSVSEWEALTLAHIQKTSGEDRI